MKAHKKKNNVPALQDIRKIIYSLTDNIAVSPCMQFWYKNYDFQKCFKMLLFLICDFQPMRYEGKI